MLLQNVIIVLIRADNMLWLYMFLRMLLRPWIMLRNGLMMVYELSSMLIKKNWDMIWWWFIGFKVCLWDWEMKYVFWAFMMSQGC
jgi:hypothetical protein